MLEILEFIMKIMRWLKYFGYRKKIAKIIKNNDITDYLLDPNENGFITEIKHQGLKGFNIKPFTSFGFEVTDDKIKFTCSLKFHYLYWIVRQIYEIKSINKNTLYYKNFTFEIDKKFIKWIGGRRFVDAVYILYKIRDNLHRGTVEKPLDLTWEEWDKQLNYIRAYINFYIACNYSNALLLTTRGGDVYSDLKERIIKGYEALKLYWRIFDL